MGAIGVLGPVILAGDATVLAPRERVVLAALTVRRGETIRADTLADALWEGSPPPSWPKVVQGCVVRLRKLLGTQAIETRPGGYCLVVAAEQVDAARFERLVARGHELIAQGEPERAAYVIGEALELWRGPALAELDGWAPGRHEAARLDELRLDAEESYIDAALRAGQYRKVIADAQLRVSQAPLREHRWTLLATAQYQAGRQADALLTLRRGRSVLANDLGLDPGPEVEELEQAILSQDPSLVATTALPEASVACPYFGLVRYDVGDTDAFFGREADVLECLRRLSDAGVLAVVGPSGSGKSSLVRAGVAAALERDGRPVVVVAPGAHPVKALPGSGESPVLVVDQCEEAVTLCRDPRERHEFFDALVEHSRRAPLIVALRADRLGEISAYPEFAHIVERGLFLLKPMDERGLRAAIEGPARQAGLRLEPGLVDLLVRDVEGEPGALPLLSHALRQAWERREGRTLTVAGYQASGAIRGAVAQTAERVYAQAPPEQRPILRGMLLRLVTPIAEGEPVRHRVPRRVLATDTAHEHIVELLVSARLVTSDDDVVELAHEALARAWPRLRGWLDDDVEGHRVWRHLSAAADSWDSMGRPDSELYRGVRLANALDWHDRAGPDLNQVEREFLDSSRHAVDGERRVARRRRRAMTTALAAGLVVTSMLAASALVAQQRANEEADRADLAAQVARAGELTASAIAVGPTDPALAKLLAVAAADLAEPTLDILSVLHRTFAEDRAIGRYAWPEERLVDTFAADLHPDGARLVASGRWFRPSTSLEVYDLDSDRVEWSWEVPDADPALVVTEPFFTNDGAWVISGVEWHREREDEREVPRNLLGAHIWSAESGDVVRRIDLGPCGGAVRAASSTLLVVITEPAQCSTAASDDTERNAELIDLDTEERRVLTRGLHGDVTMSGDGNLVSFTEAAGSEFVTAVVDVHSGERILEFDPTADAWFSVTGADMFSRLNHDGTLMVTGSRPLWVVDVASGEILTHFTGHGGEVHNGNFRFAPDGASVFSSGRDGTLLHWDARTGEQLAAYPAVGSGRVSIADDGRLLVADDAGGHAVLLEPGAPAEVWRLETCAGFVLANSLDVAGGHAVLSEVCWDGEVVSFVVDVANKQLIRALPGHSGGQGLALSPDGMRVVRQEADDEGDGRFDPDRQWVGPPGVRDVVTGERVTQLDGVCIFDNDRPTPEAQAGCSPFPARPFPLWNRHVAWSADASMVAAVDDISDGVMVWDAETGEMLATADSCAGAFVIFVPDAPELLGFCRDRLVGISTETWGETRSHSGEPSGDDVDSLAPVGFSADASTLLAVGGAMGVGGGSVHWINVDSLETEFIVPRAHAGTPKSWAMGPDRTLLATGSSDGFVKVWSVDERRQVHEIYLGETQVQGVAFVNDRHLAVAPEDGGVYVYTLDPAELLETVRASLSRGFTTTECERFNFSDGCPPLADLRGDG